MPVLLLLSCCCSLRAKGSRLLVLRGTPQDVLPRIVKVFGAGGIRGLEHYGSGFLISSDGDIVTVWSHVLDADAIAASISATIRSA